MASGEKRKISWFKRVLKRNNSDLNNSDFEEIDLEDTLDNDLLEDMDGEEATLDEELFDSDSENIEVPAERAEAESLQINLIDKGDALVAQALVPGIEENSIDIDINREMLTITAGSNEHCIENEGDYLYEEISFGSFSRSILLPAEIEVEDAKAEVKDGVLTVTMPKINKDARKKLPVKKK